MVRAKPDPTGRRFGRLTVLEKGDRKPDGRNSYIQFWLCRCDCGALVQRRRRDLERSKIPSCGCEKIERCRIYTAARTKPDPTGQRFGRLVVIGKDPTKHLGKSRWLCQCDCGNITSLIRGDFDKEVGAKSCGCLYRDRKGKPNPKQKGDYTGKRFGNLVALHRVTGKLTRWGKPVWLCRCDCGKEVEISSQRLRAGWSLNCGDRAVHGWGLWYPPTPNPYPKEAGELAAKYLHLTKPREHWKMVDSRVEDEKRDRLFRVCWILTYRRQQGESISELKERRYILKSLRFASLKVRRDRRLEFNGKGRSIMKTNNFIGSEMTNATFQDYPVSESGTLETNCMSTKVRLRFKRR